MATTPADLNTKYTNELPYIPSPEQVALGCDPYKELSGVGLLSSRFGMEVAEARMVDTAIRLGLSDIPDPHFGDSVWEQRYAQTNLARITLKGCKGCPLVDSCPGAGVLSNIRGEGRPEFEKKRTESLLKLAKTLTEELPYFVLKGGLALILYGDPRSTVDLDGDIYIPADDDIFSSGHRKTTEEKIATIVNNAGGTSADKDTPTTLKLSIPMDEGNLPKPIRLEFRKHGPISKEGLDNNTALINGIRVYTPAVLVEHKVGTVLDRSKARDVFDLLWLVYSIPDALQPISSDVLEKLASKLISSNSAGEQIIDETMVTELSSAKGGVPSWVDKDVARKIMVQIHGYIAEELSARTI